MRRRFHGYVSTKSAMDLSSLRVTSSSRDRSTLCQISVNVEHLRCICHNACSSSCVALV